MKLLRIHFITGKVHEMRLQDVDAENIAGTLNVDPNGTNRINAPDGTLILNRNHITHIQILPA
jgi:hypothetical protein